MSIAEGFHAMTGKKHLFTVMRASENKQSMAKESMITGRAHVAILEGAQ